MLTPMQLDMGLVSLETLVQEWVLVLVGKTLQSWFANPGLKARPLVPVPSTGIDLGLLVLVSNTNRE
jgi:hypothetical protein